MTSHDKTDQIDPDQKAPKAEVGDADRRLRDGIGQGAEAPQSKPTPPKEYGGRKQGLDPTRYGDWEKNGRCIDF
jgi:hypothetical protein